jgi:predicted permease
VKSFRGLVRIDLGLRPENVTVVQLPLPQTTYDQRRTTTFIQTLLEQVRAVPAVRSASLSWYMPYDGNTDVNGYLIEGRPVPTSGAEAQATQIAVSPGYFATLGIPLRRGRDFMFADDSAALPVVIVDDEMARRHWPNGDAIGKRMRPTGDTTWLTIVGVVGSTRDEDAATEPRPHMYFSLSQTGGSALSLAVHSATDPAAMVPSLRQTIVRVEPAIPIDAARPLTALIGASLDNRRLIELLLGGFALLAVTLAGVGIYGVMSLYVANRRREFGIRLAVGAAPGSLIRLVLGEGATLTVLGIALGIGGALLASRWIQSLLYAVSPTDPVVFGSLATTLAVIAIASCCFPAMRAAKSDPLQILRSD